jgi:hypothetical protein
MKNMLFQKLSVAQIIKIFTEIYETPRIIVVFAIARRWSLSRVRLNQFTSSYPIYLRQTLICHPINAKKFKVVYSSPSCLLSPACPDHLKMKRLFPISCHFLPITSTHSLQYPIRRILSAGLRNFLRVGDQVLNPHEKNKQNYIFVFYNFKE